MKKNQHQRYKKNFIISIGFVIALMVFATIPVSAQQTVVEINTPKWVEGTTVYATIDIDHVSNLDSGQFELSFDSGSLKVVSVEDGSIGGKIIPVQWCSLDDNTIRVIFNLEGVSGTTGSGQLAKIGFEVTGDSDNTLDISNGLLVDINANEIATDWGVNAASNVSIPGFESVIAFAGLIVISCLLLSNKK